MEKNLKRRINYKVTCPECKEASEGNIRFRRECKSHFDSYYCSLCKNEWDPSEVLKEEYKIATFVGRDGEIKFITHSESNQRKMRMSSNMWNPAALENKRDAKGKWTGRVSKKDANLLKRLREK